MTDRKEEDKVEEDAPDMNEWDELLYSPFSDLRIFNLLPNNNSIMGILVDETEDSFLVGLPAKLIKSDKEQEYSVDSYIGFPYIRFLKSAITGVTPLFGIFEEPYHAFLREEGLVNHPEYSQFLWEGFMQETPLTKEEEEMNAKIEERLMDAVSKASVGPSTRSVH